MLLRLLLLFTITPIVEFTLLFQVAQGIGVLWTIVVVLATGMGGAYLAKKQGIAAWQRIAADLKQGQLPKDSLLDGLAILIAGTLLVTPGVLTDITGLLLLIPWARKPVRAYIKKKFQQKLDRGEVTFVQYVSTSDSATRQAHSFGHRRPGEEIIDVQPADKVEVVDEPEPTESGDE